MRKIVCSSRALRARLRVPGLAVLMTVSALSVAGCAAAPDEAADPMPMRMTGTAVSVGAGTATGYAEFDDAGAPAAIGIAFSGNFFAELPTAHSDFKRCFDRDSNGEIDDMAECNAWHEWVVALPDEVVGHQGVPFKWALLNWNPMGHIPPGVYDTPHFDMHFYIQPAEEVFAIESGPCGPEFVRCDQFEIAKKPLPPNYVAPDYQDVEAVAPAMGNHLIDTTSSEFQGVPFTRTWIYGKYDGEVTFYEEMVTRAYLESRPSECFPIKSPPAVGLTGYYPTSSCLRYDPATDEYTVSMEGFTHREASPPDPVPEGEQARAF